MSDEEYERFEVTDHDLQNEFNPNRYRKRTSKQQQIYGKCYTFFCKRLEIWKKNNAFLSLTKGIWAEDSDEEVEEKVDRRGRRKPVVCILIIFSTNKN
jgi:hypothetical protein